MSRPSSRGTVRPRAPPILRVSMLLRRSHRCRCSCTASLRSPRAPGGGQRALAGRERRVRLAEGQREGRGAAHLPPRRRASAARPRVGRDQRARAVAGAPAGAVPLGLRGRLGQVPQRQVLEDASRTAAGRTTARRSPMLVAACKAPNGSYWTVQAWQRRLPLLGFDPWLPAQIELGAPPRRTSPASSRSSRCSRTGRTAAAGRALFGRYTYLGQPIFGFGANAEGRAEGQVRPEPLHRHAQLARTGRAGSASRGSSRTRGRARSATASSRSGRSPGYPSQDMRPAGRRRAASRHRRWAPACMPVMQVEVAGLDAGRPRTRRRVQRRLRPGDGGDKACAAER